MKILNNTRINKRNKSKIHKYYQIKSYKTHKKIKRKLIKKNISLDGPTLKSYYK